MLLEGAKRAEDRDNWNGSNGSKEIMIVAPHGMNFKPQQKDENNTEVKINVMDGFMSSTEKFVPLKKRKAISDPKSTIIPDSAVVSKEKAQEYLRALNKKSRLGEKHAKSSGTFRMFVGADDFDNYEGFIDNPKGVAVVDLKQPPLQE
ncbi:hypothetical protein RND81_03G048500 [Saponaria officinalis]|uniref:Uncharacterized protein n=1 Tax=Saponaria officinalis TaxID=3572 RepID=A0AAW1LY82_SAPOF